MPFVLLVCDKSIGITHTFTHVIVQYVRVQLGGDALRIAKNLVCKVGCFRLSVSDWAMGNGYT